jgi:hypothetical protein
MYPQQELNQLAVCKAVLRRDIARRRVQCAAAAARVAQPLEWMDRMLAIWRQISPLAQFAAAPLGLLVRRIVFPHGKILRTLMRWSPLVFGAVRVVGRAVNARVKPSNSSNGQFAHRSS